MKRWIVTFALLALAACQAEITLPPITLVDAGDGGAPDTSTTDAESAD